MMKNKKMWLKIKKKETTFQANTTILLFLVTVIDLTGMTAINPTIVLTLDVALQWAALKHDPREPTLLLFRFGWTEEDNNNMNIRSCTCKVPGESNEYIFNCLGRVTAFPSL